MVEFGAGGKVARREENATATTDGDAAATGATVPGSATLTGSSVPNPPAPSGGTTATGRERRKRKPKGWYCPVCRQPYTSLLRLALPANGKPMDDDSPTHVELARQPSRAASVRTTASRRAPSLAPTLPDGAEQMLDSLRPNRGRDDDEDEDDVGVDGHTHTPVPESERPQFVLGNEDEDAKDKAEVEHRESPSAPVASDAFDHAQATEEGRNNNANKGWKEASQA